MNVEPGPLLSTAASIETHPRAYRQSDLATFDLLVNRPIWVFDVERKTMWWANDAALALWSAPNLESLLARDFVEDMSESTCQRLHEIMIKFHRGERTTDQVGLWLASDREQNINSQAKIRLPFFVCSPNLFV